MKEELKQKLLNSLNEVANFVEQTKDFAAKEAPLVAQEIVNLKIIDGFTDLFIALTLLATIGLCVKVGLMCRDYITKKKEECSRIPDTPYVVLVISCILGGFLSMGFICRTTDALYAFLQVNYTPRLLILEELKSLIGGM